MADPNAAELGRTPPAPVLPACAGTRPCGHARGRIILDERGAPIDYVYLEVNDELERLAGSSGLAGRRGSEVHPSIVSLTPNPVEVYGRVCATGVAETFELFWPPRGIWLRAAAHRCAPGEFVTLVDDITALKLADESLRTSQRRLRFVLEGGALGAWDWMVGDPMVVVSRRWREITGLPGTGEESAIAHEAWIARIHPDDVASATARATELVAGLLARYDLEYRVRRGDGAWVWVHTLATVVERNPEGSARRIAGIIADVSDRKRAELALADRERQLRRDISARQEAEQRLRERERYLDAILQTALDGFVAVDADGRIVDVNPAACAMTGFSREELLERRIADLEAVEAPEDTARRIARIRASGGDRFQTRHRRKDGTFIDVRVSVRLIELGRPLMVSFLQDVTAEVERARLQAQLARSARLAEMGTLVAGVAHEINNPLSAVAANAVTALEEVRRLRDDVARHPAAGPDDLAERAHAVTEMLEDAGASASRIAGIVRDLALLGRPDPAKARIDLPEVVRGAVAALPATVDERAEVRCDLEPVPPVSASAGQIQQVLSNLIVNAALSAPRDRRARVVVRLRRAPGDAVHLEVSDDGPGVPSHLRDRIFEPFFTTRPAGQGTGLGLSICQSIVSAHGGKLSLLEGTGGATFRIELPLPQDGSAPADAQGGRAHLPGAPRVPTPL